MIVYAYQIGMVWSHHVEIKHDVTSDGSVVFKEHQVFCILHLFQNHQGDTVYARVLLQHPWTHIQRHSHACRLTGEKVKGISICAFSLTIMIVRVLKVYLISMRLHSY